MTLGQAVQVFVRKCFPPGDPVLEKLELFAVYLGDLDMVWEFLDGRYGHLMEMLTYANDEIWILKSATDDVASILHLYRKAGLIDRTMMASPLQAMWPGHHVTTQLYEKLPESERALADLDDQDGPPEYPRQFVLQFMARRVRELKEQESKVSVVQVGTTFSFRNQSTGLPTAEAPLRNADDHPPRSVMHWAEVEEWDDYDRTGIWGSIYCTPEQPHKASECVPPKLKPGEKPPPWDHE